MPIQFLNNTRARYSDGTGKPLAQGTIGVYVAGTSFATLATVWDTVTKDVELTNPVTLDDAGEAEIWYDVAVDIRIKDSTGAVVDTALGLDPNAASGTTTGFNKAANGSFEIDTTNDGEPDDWTIGAYSGSSIAITSTVVTNGTNALEFNTAGSGFGGGTATSAKFPVTEGTVCSVAWSFFATHASTTNTFQIKWYDEAGVLQSTSTLAMPASGAVPTSWTNYTEEVPADAAATEGQIVLTGISSGGSNLSSKAYFDGIDILNFPNMVTLAGTQTLTNKTLTAPAVTDATGSFASPVLNTAVSGTAVLDEDDLVSDSATQIATQQSIKAYVDAEKSTLETPVATTSGTAVTYTGIPSWVKKITVMFDGVSAGNSPHIITIGDSGGLETTGYLSAFTGTELTTAFILHGGTSAAAIYGSVVLTLLDSSTNTWVLSGAVYDNTSTGTVLAVAGSKSLSATLDRLSFEASGIAFDAGKVNILYE